MFQLILPQITIDLAPLSAYIAELGGKPPLYLMGRLFLDGGWIAVLLAFLWGAWKIYMMKSQRKFARGLKWILLAIDVPKDTEQSPKAVEHIFAHLTGGYRGLVKKEIYLQGQTQFYFSLEIASIDGYVQYYIWTVEKMRDLVESAIYSQYPDAQITEVEDYTRDIPRLWPNETYDFWGTEYVPVKHWANPIRTWPQFEHGLSAELKDPIATLLESMSKMRKGEQFWTQIVITPRLDDWKEESEKVINKLLGRKPPAAKKGLIGKTLDFPIETAQEFAHKALTGEFLKSEEKKERDESHFKMLGMTKGERDIIESIQMKLSRPGFSTKIRFIYLAEKPVFTKGPRIALWHGNLKQYANPAGNALRPYSKITPRGDYFWQRHKIFEYLLLGTYLTKHTRQKRLMAAYRGRSNWRGAPSYILNIEELATLWHFPSRIIRTPLLKKTEAKKGESPFKLPLSRLAPKASEEGAPEKTSGTPGNLPFV